VGPEIDRVTFEDLATMLENDYVANGRRSLRGIRQSRLPNLRRFFGEDRAIDITTDRVTAYIAQRQAEGAASATVNRELSALGRAFRLGEDAGKVTRRPRISKLQEAPPRAGFFERDQLEALITHLPEDLRSLILVAYWTGWRVPSELLTRQRHHVDLDAGWLRLEPGQTKNGQGRMFPLFDADGAPTELHAILQEQIERTQVLERDRGIIVPWLFHRDGKQIRDFRYSWKKACKAAGVERLSHDFRRTAVRNLERAGVPRSAAMQMTGHLTESVYRRYAIVDESMLRQGAGDLSRLYRSEKRSVRKVVPIAQAT
jgi:integrase